MASPAPPQPDQGAAAAAQMIMQIAQAGRMIAMKVPGAADEVRQINALLQQIQRKMVGSQPAAEPAAPPV